MRSIYNYFLDLDVEETREMLGILAIHGDDAWTASMGRRPVKCLRPQHKQKPQFTEFTQHWAHYRAKQKICDSSQ